MPKQEVKTIAVEVKITYDQFDTILRAFNELQKHNLVCAGCREHHQQNDFKNIESFFRQCADNSDWIHVGEIPEGAEVAGFGFSYGDEVH